MTTSPSVVLMHYTAPPVVGGVEGIVHAHARLFLQAGFQVTVVAGRGTADALPHGVELKLVPELDPLNPELAALSTVLEQGIVPIEFESMVTRIARALTPIVGRCDHVLVHNIFTKHFNLPLTAALFDLMDARFIQHAIAWCHDISWTSAHSRSMVHPGHPWDLLRTRRPDVDYVVVSQAQQRSLAQLFQCRPDLIRVVYNGIDLDGLLGLSPEGRALIDRLDLLASDLIMLMPVRVTEAKNIELALRVTAALKRRGYQPRLVITGPPDPHDAESMTYFQALRALRSELGLEQNARFVFEASPSGADGYFIDEQRVAELFRVSDLVFMPSHREGFGLPVLEAGLIGLPVVCTDIPAAHEIGGDDVLRINATDSPESIADLIWAWTHLSRVRRLRRRVRQTYTWPTIFERDIRPLLRERALA